jgi:predicted transcriptional regulator
MPTIKTSLAATMDHLHLTQTGVALLLGTSLGSVNRWLADERTMPEPVRRLLVLLDNGRNKAAIRALDVYDPIGASVRAERVRQVKVKKPAKR